METNTINNGVRMHFQLAWMTNRMCACQIIWVDLIFGETAKQSFEATVTSPINERSCWSPYILIYDGVSDLDVGHLGRFAVQHHDFVVTCSL